MFRCPHCGKTFMAVKEICPACGKKTSEVVSDDEKVKDEYAEANHFSIGMEIGEATYKDTKKFELAGKASRLLGLFLVIMGIFGVMIGIVTSIANFFENAYYLSFIILGGGVIAMLIGFTFLMKYFNNKITNANSD